MRKREAKIRRAAVREGLFLTQRPLTAISRRVAQQEQLEQMRQSSPSALQDTTLITFPDMSV